MQSFFDFVFKQCPCDFCASSAVGVTGIIVSNDPVNRWDLLGLQGSRNPEQIARAADRQDYVSAALSGAAEGLYNSTIGATIGSVQEGSDYMAQGFQAMADGNYVEGALNITAAVGKTAEVALDIVTAGNNPTATAVKVTDKVTDLKASFKAVDKAGDANQTSRAARREAMRQNDTPTSRSATSQSTTKDAQGRTQRQTVTEGHDGKSRVQTQHHSDKNHSQSHWHDSKPKVDDRTGEMRKNDHGQIKDQNEGRSTSNYGSESKTDNKTDDNTL